MYSHPHQPHQLLCLRAWGSPTFSLDRTNPSIRDLSIIISSPTNNNNSNNNKSKQRKAGLCPQHSYQAARCQSPRSTMPSMVHSAA